LKDTQFKISESERCGLWKVSLLLFQPSVLKHTAATCKYPYFTHLTSSFILQRILPYIKSLTQKNMLQHTAEFLVLLLWPFTLTGFTEIPPQREVDFVAEVAR